MVNISKAKANRARGSRRTSEGLSAAETSFREAGGGSLIVCDIRVVYTYRISSIAPHHIILR